MFMQKFVSDIRFECPACNKWVQTQADIPEPNWGAAEKTSELISEDEVVITCPKCKEEFSGFANNSPYECSITLYDFPNTFVDAEPASFTPEDEWLDQYSDPDPHETFMDSYRHSQEILRDHGGENGNHLINRMVFTQQVTALEAYLGDTLIRAVKDNPLALSRLAEKDTTLNESKHKLSDIAANPSFVTDKVIGYLRGLVYHNIQKVDLLYRTALEIRIFGDGDLNGRLLEAIKYRHDCVHRNGNDKDGNRLDIFTKAYVGSVADLMRDLVDRVERDMAEAFNDGPPF